MRKQFITRLLILAWLISLAINVARAQINTRFVIHIPFEFIVSGQILPEGTYVLGRIDQTKPNILMLKNADTGMVRLLFTQRVEKWRADSETCLIFTRHGHQLHLMQIWTKGNPHGQQVPSSDEEDGRNKHGSEVSVRLILRSTSSKELKSARATNKIAESKHR